MSRLGRLMAFFPAAQLTAFGLAMTQFVRAPGALPLVAAIATLYLAAPVAFRLHAWLFPLPEGDSLLIGPGYSPWWGGHQIQILYIAVPQLEGLLRLVPGLYSAWLRLWGSQIGRGVYWTPRVDVSDRSLLRIGDGVVLGHRCCLFAHIITPVPGNLRLYVRPIRIERGAFVGAGAALGPGVIVHADVLVRATARLGPNKVAA